MISEEFAVVWDSLSEETKHQVVVSYLKSLSKWDFKRMLCNVLDVDNYMDDEGLREATESIINERKAMEKYNWIKAYYEEKEVFVRQEVKQSDTFVDDEGNRFHISELDLTRGDYEPRIFNPEEFEKRNKEINQQYQESQAMYMEMLSKMDANSIADHKAKIDEREYWRKLRGDIFLEYCKRESVETTIEALNVTDEIIKALHAQDQEFFKDK